MRFAIMVPTWTEVPRADSTESRHALRMRNTVGSRCGGRWSSLEVRGRGGRERSRGRGRHMGWGRRVCWTTRCRSLDLYGSDSPDKRFPSFSRLFPPRVDGAGGGRSRAAPGGTERRCKLRERPGEWIQGHGGETGFIVHSFATCASRPTSCSPR